MRKLIAMLVASMVLAACAEKKPETETPAEKVPVTEVKSEVKLPYVPSYSSSFEIGNAEHVRTILQGSWKDWEENKLDKTAWLSDSVVAYQSDNSVVKGADNLMALWKKNRAQYSKVITTVDAATALYSADKKENWVVVWATEIDTKGGKTDTVSLVETWRINKDGKADLLYQFDRKTRKN